MRRTISAGLVGAGAVLIGVGALPAAADEASWSVTASPASAAVGETVTISGTLECPGMSEDGRVLVRMLTDDATRTANLGAAELGPDDTFSLTATVPAEMADLLEMGPVATEPGAYLLDAWCSEAPGDPNSVDGTFTVIAGSGPTTEAPPVTAAPPPTPPSGPSVPPAPPEATSFTPPAQPPADAVPFTGAAPGPLAPGATLRIDEGGFEPGEPVHVVLHSTPTVLATLTADAGGTVRGAVRIPAGTSAGPHTLVLYGASTVKALAIQVAAPAQTLPRTGSEVPWLSALGVALVTSGLVLTRRSRAGLRAAR